MNRVKNILDFYVLCNKLKDIVRTGWKYWEVDRDRLESVAEHIFGVQILAIAIYSEYKYDIDILKVIYMLVVHELEEVIIGDLTEFDIDRNEKMIKGHEAIKIVLKDLSIKDEIENLILEFDERKTKEAKFAYYCDKLECDIQCKLYDCEGLVDIYSKKDKLQTNIEENLKKIENNEIRWSDMWLEHDKTKFLGDDNFIELLDYIKNNKIK